MSYTSKMSGIRDWSVRASARTEEIIWAIACSQKRGRVMHHAVHDMRHTCSGPSALRAGKHWASAFLVEVACSIAPLQSAARGSF